MTAPPRAVHRALLVLAAESLLALLSGVFAVVQRAEIEEYLQAHYRGTDIGERELQDLVTTTIGVAVVGGLLFTGIWLWLAYYLGGGRNWARVVGCILAGLGVLWGLLRYTTVQTPGVRLFDTAGLLLDVALLVALTRPDVKAWVGAVKPYRAPGRRRPVPG